jgi:hypothetical protein
MYLLLSPLMVQQPIVDQGRPIIDISRSHSDTPYLLGLLWTSDLPDAKLVPDNI